MGTFEIKKSTNDEYYFVLKASNGEIIASSETYTSKQSCKHGIEAVKTYAPQAETQDHSS